MTTIEKIDIIELNLDSGDYTLDLPSNEPLVLGENAQVGLKSYMLFYTLPNICPEFKNNKLKVKYNNNWIDIEIESGMYEVSRLSTIINRKVILGRDVLGANEKEPNNVLHLDVDKSTFHCLVRLNPGVELDFSEGELYKILGLEPKIYTTNTRSKDFINITRGSEQIYIRCNLIERKYQYLIRDVLYCIMPTASPGEILTNEIDPVEYYDCPNRFIRSINIKLTNENNEVFSIKDKVHLKIFCKHHVILK